MTIDERLDRLERAWGAQDEIVRELRDAAFVHAQLEAQQSRRIKEHAEWLAANEFAMLRHREWLVEHDRIMKDIDERISSLVSGFGEFMRRERPSA